MSTSARTSTRIPTSFGERLSYARRKAGMTQLALGDASGVEPTTISRLEKSGKKNRVFVETAAALALAIGCSAGWLAFGEGKPGPIPLSLTGFDRRLYREGRNRRVLA